MIRRQEADRLVVVTAFRINIPQDLGNVIVENVRIVLFDDAFQRGNRAIIDCIVQGDSNREIAGKLNLSEGTIRNSLSNILLKLGLRNRTQLAIWAVQSDVASLRGGE